MIKVLDTVSGQTFIFPMLPEKVTFEAGTNFISYDLMNVGEVKVPSGEILSTISFDGTLPSAKRKNAPYVSNWREPKEIQSLFSVWRHYGRKLRLTMDGTPINHAVYLDTYKIDYEGGVGDYTYSISFVAAKNVTAELSQSTTRTYVTVPGDTLWSVAQKETGSGSNYQQVKEENKAVLEMAGTAAVSGALNGLSAGTGLMVSASAALRAAEAERANTTSTTVKQNTGVGGGASKFAQAIFD